MIAMRLVLTLLAIVGMVGCVPGTRAPATSPAPSFASPTEIEPADTPSAVLPSSPPAAAIPLCDDVPYLSAPSESYGDAPIYVSNEMEDLIGPIQSWAEGKPGFAGIWIDRQHHGWVSVAFTVDAQQRQADLRAMYPNDGVVAVPVDWTEAELRAIQDRVLADFFQAYDIGGGTGVRVNKGVATIELAVRRPEWVALAEEMFAGQPVCISGLDPADAPADGPQSGSGEGWRLLGDADNVGPAYRTGIAFDEDSYAQLWAESEIIEPRPDVDFDLDVVIWFGAVTGSSCPELRLDDVVVDAGRSLVYAEIVNLSGEVACTADIHPHAYVVALARESLPPTGFSIQLNEGGPPPGAPEERTVVEADLTQPGSIAAPGDVHGDPDLPEPYIVEAGGYIEPGFPMPFRQSTACGLTWLGPLNDVSWHTAAAGDASDWIPDQWAGEITEDSWIILEVEVETGAVPTLTATSNDHAVVYRASTQAGPGCDS